MKRNMGNLDRGMRILAAILLLWIAFGTSLAASGLWHWAPVAVALVFLVTAVLGNCPIFSILGIRTCRAN